MTKIKGLIGGGALVGITSLLFFLFSSWAYATSAKPQLSDAELLRSLFTAPGCIRACYQGIEPEKTTIEEAEVILKSMDIPNERNYIYGDFYEIYADDKTLPLKFQHHDWPRFSIDFDDQNGNKIWQVWFPSSFAVPYRLVIEAFGYPDRVDVSNRFEGAFEGFAFVYLSKGMYFGFDFDTGLSSDVRITDHRHDYMSVFSSKQGNLADYPCLTYSTMFCLVPTATSDPITSRP